RILSLAEVQVFSQGQNLAVKGTAEQSSTDFDGPARLAIDGNTDGRYYEAKSTTHTRTEANPWWEVKLAEARPIDQVVIWNRTDGGGGVGLANFRVLGLDDARKTVWQQTVAEPPNPKRELSPSGRQTVVLTQAAADHSQEKFPVADVLKADARNGGWAVGPAVQAPHTAVFLANGSLATADVELTFRLEHRSKLAGYNLGRFRLSVTNDARLLQR